MEQIKILKVVSKTTKALKPYKMCEVLCSGEVRKVNIWSNAPDFSNLQEGSVIMGKMTLDGEYWNITFGEAEKRPVGQNYAFKTAQIEKAQENKAQYIAKAQDNKDWGIMVSSTMRDAVLLAIAEYKDKTVLDTLDQAVLKWRTWLLENWEVDKTDIPPFD